ncbi:hypothetical protein Tco_0976896 [Tanacetum coccineum]|uniref:Replication factor A C-terminal domain-containing protein n=1 Tax=Tanacetum coccineum TaxID=301880 RepID=A0ABQ5EIK2_9ASTR
MYFTKLHISDDIPKIAAFKQRYTVIVRVINDTGSTSLLLFDDMVFKLSEEQCYNLIKQHGPNYDDYFPDELNILVGKRLLFRFHYIDEHITNNNHVYQVKMMSGDEAMITLFKKDFIIKDVIDDMQTPLLSNAKSSKFNTVDTIPFNIVETPKLADESPKGNRSNGDSEGSSKAIESDRGDSGSGKHTIIDHDDNDEKEGKAKRVKKVVQVKVEPKD